LRIVWIVAFLIILAPALSQELNLTLIKPSNGVSAKETFELSIRTEQMTSACKYANSPTLDFEDIQKFSNIFTRLDNYTHRIANFTDLEAGGERTLHIKCSLQNGTVLSASPLRLSVDKTKPVIKLSMEDDVVIETLDADIDIKADEPVICRYDDRNSTYGNLRFAVDSGYLSDTSLILDRNTPIALQDQRNYTIFIACSNKAGLNSTASNILFRTDLDAPNQILGTGPSGTITGTNATLYVRTNRRAACRYADSEFSGQHTTYNHRQIFDLQEGKHMYQVQCIYDLGGPDGFTEIKFTVDRTPPTNLTIRTENSSCATDSLGADFEAQDNIDIDYYEFRILEGTEAITEWEKSDSTARKKLELVPGRTYFWAAKAVDVSGNIGPEAKSGAIVIKDANSTECRKNLPPSIRPEVTDIPGGKKISLSCSDLDPEDQCLVSAFVRYDGDAYCDCDTCKLEPYMLPIDIYRNATVCYSATDTKGLSIKGSKRIEILRACLSSPDSCCVKDLDGVCDGDCLPAVDPDCKVCPAGQSKCPEGQCKEDCDNDGIPDVWEKANRLDPASYQDYNFDPDGDRLTNFQEFNMTEAFNRSTNPQMKDTDGDGCDDGSEFFGGTNPVLGGDCKKDDAIDRNKDSDKDGITDVDELKCGLNPNDIADAKKDKDIDGISNGDECKLGTDWQKPDTDGDGSPDGDERKAGTKPLDPDDHPESSITPIVIIGGSLTAILIAAGVFMFGKKKPLPASIPPAHAQQAAPQPSMPIIQRAERSPFQQPAQPVQPQPVQRQVQDRESHIEEEQDLRGDAGDQIFRRKRILLKKRRNHLFDIFDEDQELQVKVIKKQAEVHAEPVKVIPPKPRSVFDALSSILRSDRIFRDLSSVSNSVDKSRLDELGRSDTKSKLDRLTARKKRN